MVWGMDRHTRAVVARVVVTLALLAGGPVLAQSQNGQGQNSTGGGSRWVPEFDPAAAGVIAAIVAGGGILLARRRRKS